MVIELFSHQEKMRENIDYNFFYNMTTFYFIFKFIAERVELKWDSLPGGDGKIGVVVAKIQRPLYISLSLWFTN